MDKGIETCGIMDEADIIAGSRNDVDVENYESDKIIILTKQRTPSRTWLNTDISRGRCENI